MTETPREAADRLDRAQREGEQLRDWSRWWQRRGAEQLSLILWAAWDPIGAGVPRDEYDGQALTLGRELREGRNAQEIAAWLADHSLLAAPDESPATASAHDLEVAEKVTGWYASEMDRERRLSR
jgi:hypothetical protein